MGLRRKDVVNRMQVGVYHVTTRCVRQAFLLGTDYQIGSSNHERKSWIEQWFQSLTDVMLIELCAYAVMDNHTHSILRNRPDLLEEMDDREVAIRLARLYPGYQCLQGLPVEPDPERVHELLDNPEELKRRKIQLVDISIFMARWEEAVARRANKEEDRTGRFWEGRFYCQKLLDSAAILAATVYVELNPLRANIVELPEYSQFTSLVNRIKLSTARAGRTPEELVERASPRLEYEAGSSGDGPTAVSNVMDCDGFLPIDNQRYLRVLEFVSRRKANGKTCEMLHSVPDLLTRLGVRPEKWRQTATTFEKAYRKFAGSPALLSEVADNLEQRCIHGISTAQRVYLSN